MGQPCGDAMNVESGDGTPGGGPVRAGCRLGLPARCSLALPVFGDYSACVGILVSGLTVKL